MKYATIIDTYKMMFHNIMKKKGKDERKKGIIVVGQVYISHYFMKVCL